MTRQNIKRDSDVSLSMKKNAGDLVDITLNDYFQLKNRRAMSSSNMKEFLENNQQNNQRQLWTPKNLNLKAFNFSNDFQRKFVLNTPQNQDKKKRRHISFSEINYKPSYLDVPVQDYDSFISHLKTQLSKIENQDPKNLNNTQQFEIDHDKNKENQKLSNSPKLLQTNRTQKLTQRQSITLCNKQSTSRHLLPYEEQQQRQLDRQEVDFNLKFNKKNLDNQLVEMQSDINNQYLNKIVLPVEHRISYLQKKFRRFVQLKKFQEFIRRVLVIKNMVKTLKLVELRSRCSGTFVKLARVCELKYDRKSRFNKRQERLRWIIERQIQKQIVNHVRYTIVAGILTRFYNKFLLDLKNERVTYPGKPSKVLENETEIDSKNRHSKHLKKNEQSIKDLALLSSGSVTNKQKTLITDQFFHQPTKFGIVFNHVDLEKKFLKNPKLRLGKLQSADDIAHLISAMQSEISSPKRVFGQDTEKVLLPQHLRITEHISQAQQMVRSPKEQNLFSQFLKCLVHVIISKQGIEKRTFICSIKKNEQSFTIKQLIGIFPIITKCWK
eukprot:403369466